MVAALAALGLIVADTAGLLLIRTYLSDRIDEQLTAMARPFAGQPPPGVDRRCRRSAARFGTDSVVYVYGAGRRARPGAQHRAGGDQAGAGVLRRRPARAPARAGRSPCRPRTAAPTGG